MRRAILMAPVLGLLAVAPASALDTGLTLRGGAFFPRADSNRFSDDAELFAREKSPNTGLQKKDWIGGYGGIEFNVRAVRNLEVAFHVDGYGRQLETVDLGYERQDGRPIRQRLELAIVPMGVTVRLIPTSRHARFAPYLGVGADLFFWSYEERGDFTDYQDPTHPVFSDHFKSSGVTPGVHVTGGVRVGLNAANDFAVAID